jgi:hypothetical protein
MKTCIKLLLVALMPYIFMACKKDITPTKSDLMIKSIDYSFGGQNSMNHSNYDFEYSENNILKRVNLEGYLTYDFFFTIPSYQGSIFELDQNMCQNEGNNYNGEDQLLVLDNSNKVKQSVLKYGINVPSLGYLVSEAPTNFLYSNNSLVRIENTYYRDTISNFIYINNKLNSFIQESFTSYLGSLIDTSISYALGYQTTTPDTSVIKVNGINNLILCIPLKVQETLPFLVVDDRLSLTGVKQKYLINGISVVEKRDNIVQKTTNYTINYLYDLEGRITHVQWINNATLAIYREAVIGYL